MELQEEGDVTVQVSFVTKVHKYAVSDAPIGVPIKLRRYALSEIINHLLALDTPVVFDFLIDGQFLRSSIEKHLQEKGLSTENVLVVEYAEALPPPSPITSFKHDDWVAAAHTGQNGLFLTGTYDNAVQIWVASGQCLATARVHTAPVKRVQWIPKAEQSTYSGDLCVSASQDHTLIIWEYNSEDDQLEAKNHLKGHTGSVDGVAVSPDGTQIISASYDHTLRIWDVMGDGEATGEKGKRQKMADGQAKAMVPMASAAMLAGHQGPASAIVWGERKSVFSAGWDHTIRQWDLNTGVNVHTMTGLKSITDLSYSSGSNLLATAGADKLLRIWDPRERGGIVVKLKLASHTDMVSCVAWSPSNSHQVVSGGYDGAWKIWDIRSSGPLHSTQ
eukprot:Ihof_evm2s501 gene=Ihof_evmTU2s501